MCEKAKLYCTVSNRSFVLGLGGNVPSLWGNPVESLARALSELERSGLAVVGCSPLFETRPFGTLRQPSYVNAVAIVGGSIAPAALLRLLKSLERRAGRRAGPRWGPRPLDIDILDHGGRRSSAMAMDSLDRRLVLPHPGIARRGFVLVPLVAIAPRWRHPVLGVSAADLLRRRPALRRGICPIGRLPERATVSFRRP